MTQKYTSEMQLIFWKNLQGFVSDLSSMEITIYYSIYINISPYFLWMKSYKAPLLFHNLLAYVT